MNMENQRNGEISQSRNKYGNGSVSENTTPTTSITPEIRNQMAFYTSRVDDDGNEIERHHLAHSAPLPVTGAIRKNQTSRSLNTKSSVRYINPAAFIESDDKYSPAVVEIQSGIVPPLDLQSEENYPTSPEYTFSYQRYCEATKLVAEPDVAYETWLSAKRKIIFDEAVRRKTAEEQKRQEQEERKRLADIKFQQWLETKTKQQTQSREKFHPEDNIEEKPGRPQVPEKEVQERLEEWERTKQLEDERRRMLKRQEEELQRELEEQRRQRAAEAWEKWVVAAAKKPKPVPLNRGIFTLRGTVSNIFVNPNEWQSTSPTKEGN